MPAAAHSLLEYAPPEFARLTQGLPLHPADGGNPNERENFRQFAMANFIYASLNQHSAIWTDATSASSSHLAVTCSSHSLTGPDAHVPGYVLDREGAIPEQRLAAAVRQALPAVKDVCARPSTYLPEMGVWQCPQCGVTIDPDHLKIDERALIAAHLGVGPDCGVIGQDNGPVRLDRNNPWQFMRSVDCLGWDHFAWHLRSECIVFWYPSPARIYEARAPGLWWDEELLNQRHVYRPLRLEIEALERTEGYQLRMWKAKQMLTMAKRGVHAARFHLTRWRREAVLAREALVRQMFQAGRGIVDTGLALVALMDEEREDAVRNGLEASRDKNRALRREWEARKESWSRAYLGH